MPESHFLLARLRVCLIVPAILANALVGPSTVLSCSVQNHQTFPNICGEQSQKNTTHIAVCIADWFGSKACPNGRRRFAWGGWIARDLKTSWRSPRRVSQPFRVSIATLAPLEVPPRIGCDKAHRQQGFLRAGSLLPSRKPVMHSSPNARSRSLLCAKWR
jgi:hypothetical protein